MQQLFIADQSARSIKSQVCDVVQTIVTTVHQIYSVFYSDGSNKTPDNKDKGKSRLDVDCLTIKRQIKPCSHAVLAFASNVYGNK